jgi:DNA-binding winged helix-turn-helix (wHTH) protein/tetratricopeptide (TPR) repeat protein
MRGDNSLTEKGVYEFGDFRLDTRERAIESAGRPLSIAPKALDLLIVLVENCGRIVDKQELMTKVWPDTFVEDNNLAFNISVLRKLFGESGASPRFIETISKRGYRFIADVVRVPDELSAMNGSPAPVVAPAYVAGPPPAPARSAQWRILAGALFIVAAAGILTSRFHRVPKLTDRDTIVLADFVNKTGDPVFDGTLQQGITVQLEQSPYLRLIPEGRVRQTLRLMGQRAGAPLTAELARDLCQRTGSAAVVEGSIASLGTQYVVGLRAVNCVSGDVLDNEQLQAGEKNDVLNSLSQIVRNFRSRVGESPASLSHNDTPLAEATTPSLEALKAYTTGLKVHFSTGALTALPLFRRAVEIDPEFAMAYSYLGRMYANLDESDLAAESIRRSWQLRDRVSDREKFQIDTRYEALLTGNLEETRQTCEAWVRTYPRDPQPHIGLSNYYQSAGQYEKAAAEAEKAIGIDPDFSSGYDSLAHNDIYLDRLGDAGETLRRAAAHGLEIDEFAMLRYRIAFLDGDETGMERIAAQAREKSGAENWIFSRQAFTLAYSGRLRQARKLSQLAAEQATLAGQRERAGLWEAGAALREAFFGNNAAAAKRASAALTLSKDREAEYGAAFALALAGYSSSSLQLANDLEKRFPEDTSVRFSYLPALRSLLALNSREISKALELLQTAIPSELGVPRSANGLFGALYPVYVRGLAHLAAHQGAEAAIEFQEILDHRGIVASDPVGALVHLQIGRAFALSGDKAKAKTAYQDFLTLWKDADPDIPVFREARAELAKLN